MTKAVQEAMERRLKYLAGDLGIYKKTGWEEDGIVLADAFLALKASEQMNELHNREIKEMLTKLEEERKEIQEKCQHTECTEQLSTNKLFCDTCGKEIGT